MRERLVITKEEYKKLHIESIDRMTDEEYERFLDDERHDVFLYGVGCISEKEFSSEVLQAVKDRNVSSMVILTYLTPDGICEFTIDYYKRISE